MGRAVEEEFLVREIRALLLFGLATAFCGSSSAQVLVQNQPTLPAQSDQPEQAQHGRAPTMYDPLT